MGRWRWSTWTTQREHSETTHDMGIHAIEAARDRRIAFSEREEGLVV